MDTACGADAQGAALTAPYCHALIERGLLGIVQFSGAEEVPGRVRRSHRGAVAVDRARAMIARVCARSRR